MLEVHWKGLTFTRRRIAEIASVVVLFVLGLALPYLSLRYVNFTSEVVVGHERMFGAADLIGGLDPTYLFTQTPSDRDALNLALNVFGAGPGIQEVASVIAVLTCWGLFYDEINKFLFWPLHLTGYVLVLSAVPLLIGLHLLHAGGVVVSLGPGWIAPVVLGIVVLVLTFRARDRLDTYGGV